MADQHLVFTQAEVNMTKKDNPDQDLHYEESTNANNVSITKRLIG